VAVVSTYAFIKQGDFIDIINICEKLIADKEDLIQKACGWMLREVGKKDVYILKNFLNKFDQKMSRTTLRYAIERFDKKERQKYLNGKV
jgi:3-methyladenine DNA glycosylase AlkD